MPNLEEYYKKSWELLKQQGTASNQKDSSSLLELSLLIMHCVEVLILNICTVLRYIGCLIQVTKIWNMLRYREGVGN